MSDCGDSDGEWLPLVRQQNESTSHTGKNPVLNKLLSSKQRLLSLTSSPPLQKSPSFSPSLGNSLQDDGASKAAQEDNTIFKKFIPGSKVRDALLFRKSAERDDGEQDKDSYFQRLLRGSKDEDVRKSVDREDEEKDKDRFCRRLLKDSIDDNEDKEKGGFFQRLLKDSKEDEEFTSSSDFFFKRLFRDSKIDPEVQSGLKSVEDGEKEGFFRKLFRDKSEDKKDGGNRNEGENKIMKSAEDDEKKGFFRKFFKEKSEEKTDGNGGANHKCKEESKLTKSAEDDEKNGFFRKFFKDKSEEKKDGTGVTDDECKGQVHGREEETSEFSFFN